MATNGDGIAFPEEIISNILRLYAPNGIDADLTYSKGFFYKSGEVPQPKLKFDITPQTTAVLFKYPFDFSDALSVVFKQLWLCREYAEPSRQPNPGSDEYRSAAHGSRHIRN